jgi:heavy metal response regulator
MRILIVEDDRKIADVLAQGLKEAGFEADVAYDGNVGLCVAEAGAHDLIVLDVMLPGIDGWQLLASLRESLHTPVLMLTARDGVEDRVRGLQMGADDYLVKPFALAELLARVQTILRRGKTIPDSVLRVGDVELDILRRSAVRGDRNLALTAKEFALLVLFMRRSGAPLSRAMIASEVWDIDFDTDTNTVDVAVRRLRSKLESEAEPKLIHTVRGIGYVMEARGGQLALLRQSGRLRTIIDGLAET